MLAQKALVLLKVGFELVNQMASLQITKAYVVKSKIAIIKWNRFCSSLRKIMMR